MASSKDQCYEDADAALRKCHEQVNHAHMTDIAKANALTDDEAKEAALKEAQERMITGYQLCEQAHRDEVSACDSIYPD
jgi:hypothetical protein